MDDQLIQFLAYDFLAYTALHVFLLHEYPADSDPILHTPYQWHDVIPDL